MPLGSTTREGDIAHRASFILELVTPQNLKTTSQTVYYPLITYFLISRVAVDEPTCEWQVLE